MNRVSLNDPVWETDGGALGELAGGWGGGPYRGGDNLTNSAPNMETHRAVGRHIIRQPGRFHAPGTTSTGILAAAIRHGAHQRRMRDNFERRSFGKSDNPCGTEMRKSPTEWMTGKRSVAPGGGRGGRKRVDVQNSVPYRWNKVNKPGEGPITHPANQPGWQNEWLRNSSLFDEHEGNILLYSNPAPPGKRQSKSPFGPPSKLYPRLLEYDGSYNGSRKIQGGYTISTIRQGTRTAEGGGKTIARKTIARKTIARKTIARKTIAGKKQNDGEKAWRHDLQRNGGKQGRFVNKNALANKSGMTSKRHNRLFKEPHVALRHEYDWIGGYRTMAPRLFMAPVLAAFFRDYFPKLYKDMMEK